MKQNKRKQLEKQWGKKLTSLLPFKKAKVSVHFLPLLCGFLCLLVLGSTFFFSSAMEKWLQLYPHLEMQPQSLEVHFVNVGQGDAILVRLPNQQTMLIDSGPATSKKELLFYLENVFLKPYENTLDYVVLSHSDADHSGNMNSILSSYQVLNFFRPAIYSQNLESDITPNYGFVVNTPLYDELINTMQQKQMEGMNVVFCESGLTIGDQTTNFVTFLSPNVNRYSTVNNYSPVILLESYGKKVMLTGDVTSDVELEVLNNHNEQLLDVDVLKLAHHGSNTSTSMPFLETVKPEFAVVSVAKNNTYGHPSLEAYNNLFTYSLQSNSNLKNQILTTSELGNIVFELNPSEEVKVHTIRNAEQYLYLPWWLVNTVFMVSVFVATLTKGVKVTHKKASNT